MNPLKVVFSALLLFSLSLTGCSVQTVPLTESDTETSATEAVTNTPKLQQTPRNLQLGGVDISRYKIVYAMNEAKPYVIGQSSDFWSDDYDAELQTAKRLAEILKAYCNVELEIGVDMSTPKSEYEILIGVTNRQESKTAATVVLDTDNYEIGMVGTKLVVRGGAYGSMYHGLDGLENWLQSDLENNLYNLTESDPIVGSYRLKHVACIGDSITEGYSASNRKYLSYVATLGRMCWRECEVFNYGRGSKTMRSDFEDSYQLCDQWLACLENDVQYDVILVMLGTNDSNRDRDWTARDNDLYIASAREIVDRVKSRSPNAKFVIMNCPAYYGSANYGSSSVRAAQSETVDALQSEGYAVRLYDMYTFTVNHLGKERFPDKLHPDDRGHFEIARAVDEMLHLLEEGKNNQYLIK